MNLDQYPIISDGSHLAYKFESIGPKGIIKKFILYQRIRSQNSTYYNLSFGDWDKIKGRIDDTIVSNNSDAKKILITVARSALQFSTQFPRAHILVVGSTRSRTRLYQMAFRQHIDEIDKLFEIQGYIENEWRKFESGINYDAFLFTKKPNKR